MQKNYLNGYMRPEGFDLARLINDDFFDPVRLLFNENYYVSASKLLMVAIDSVGFLEYGDNGVPFKKWLTTYCDLAPVGVNPEELWEQRNSLLHMSNLNSRSVVAGKVKRLIMYVGVAPDGMPKEDEEAKYFNFNELISALDPAINKWIDSYNADPSKFPDLFARYDLVTSDKRMFWAYIGKSDTSS